MKTPKSLLSLMTVLVLAGCGQAPVPVMPGEREPTAHAFVPHPTFEVLQAAPFGTAITASSEANTTFYALTNATDGIQTTSWRPMSSDAFPWLRFDLSDAIDLSALAIKLSLGPGASVSQSRVYLSVQTSDDGTNWQTLATGLQPTETVLQPLELPDTQTRHVRLSFVASGTNRISDLLVCEVQLLEAAPVNSPGDPGDLGDPGDPGDPVDPVDPGAPGNGGGGGTGGNGGGGCNGGNCGQGQGNGGGNGTPNEGRGRNR